ncbi:MAG: DUF2934 domain-containing protein [Tardiphaga sp.]
MQNMELAIRERAYAKWDEAGRPDGNADAFWLSAQREILAASLSQIARVSEPSLAAAKPKRTRKPAAPKKKRAA